MTVLIVQAEEFLPLNHLPDLCSECTWWARASQVIKKSAGTTVFLLVVGCSMDGRCACRAPPYFELGTQPEVGSSALAAWLARRVAAVKCPRPMHRRPQALSTFVGIGSFRLDCGDSMVSSASQARQNGRVEMPDESSLTMILHYHLAPHAIPAFLAIAIQSEWHR